ncbi:hypothetical protein [Halococcus hamelinensis]|uniref:Uncharacterized protein n=1 Tax=Halococcus hamelinensis 100A6 TaxID=1132509 RepID=M0LZ76_9EURY|nr:hypothetical protein [Halococcus hamelinensis]EMA38458.1 hypothetical protein C447_09897 [Halococcus hamelinensis 100A6]
MTLSVEPEFLLLVASGLWVLCGLVSGLLAPPLIRLEAALLFVLLGVIGGGAGLAIILPSEDSGLLLVTAIFGFGLLPLLATTYLMLVFPSRLQRRRIANQQQ